MYLLQRLNTRDAVHPAVKPLVPDTKIVHDQLAVLEITKSSGKREQVQ